ncbi:MAG: hypothetical protein WC699_16700 [Bacteroidales bacterium]|jgi:hypothetical protein
MSRVLIGIDDTDNLESRGTGFRARQLGQTIEVAGLGILEGITRHQLFFDRRIPYTSHNSSACLEFLSDDLPGIINISRDFLLRESAEGSDAGLAAALFEQTDEEIMEWGLRAKKEILTQSEARDIAKRKSIFLEGLTGSHDGIIGSLAAIGLRKGGNDGRYIGVGKKEIRELEGIYTVQQLFREIRIDTITDQAGHEIPDHHRIHIGHWMRPVLVKNKITIIVEQAINNQNYEWTAATKDFIKGISG